MSLIIGKYKHFANIKQHFIILNKELPKTMITIDAITMI